MNPLRAQFLLDPEVVFLNHGSFGATPLPVLEERERWLRRLERQPVRFVVEELRGHLEAARAALAGRVHADPRDLVYVQNATFAVNAVARSLDLGPGDEVLSTDHEYGACRRVWDFLGAKRGFRHVRVEVPLPFPAPEAVAERIWSAVTPRTRVLFVSHVASSTAVRFPVEALCARAREAGILSFIDGAHTVGQIPLDLPALGCDVYTSNCHKWLLAPKGAAFLYARRERQPAIEPLVVGWGWGEDRPLGSGSDFLDAFQWPGTHDPSAFLAVPAAIRFQDEHDWDAVRDRCHALLAQTLSRLDAMTGMPSLYADPGGYRQMAAAFLPPGTDANGLKRRLAEEHRIEVPILEWGPHRLVRVSIQGYNDPSDAEALVAALERRLAR